MPMSCELANCNSEIGATDSNQDDTLFSMKQGRNSTHILLTPT